MTQHPSGARGTARRPQDDQHDADLREDEPRDVGRQQAVGRATESMATRDATRIGRMTDANARTNAPRSRRYADWQWGPPGGGRRCGGGPGTKRVPGRAERRTARARARRRPRPGSGHPTPGTTRQTVIGKTRQHSVDVWWQWRSAPRSRSPRWQPALWVPNLGYVMRLAGIVEHPSSRSRRRKRWFEFVGGGVVVGSGLAECAVRR